MTSPQLSEGNEQTRGARSLGGRLRQYDRLRRIFFWRKKRDELTGPPARWAWNGLLARILLINGLVVGIAGGLIYWISSARDGLIEARIQSLLTQAKIVAEVISDKATPVEANPPVLEEEATKVMSTAIVPTNTRARLFALDGRSIQDTRFLLMRNQVQTDELPPPTGAPGWSWDALWKRMVNWLPANPLGQDLPLYEEGTNVPGQAFPEFNEVLRGEEHGVGKRANANGELIMSVAVPVKRLLGTRAVLMLSTEAGDLDEIVRTRNFNLLLIWLAVLVIVMVLSLALAQNIARPIRRLAFAADQVRRGDADESVIPELSDSPDEMRALAGSFRAMTGALTDRLDTIENFAADVAHEIKNPLTSLRSAIETLSRNDDPERAKKLMALIQNDVRRIDRLISDISEASRLDAELAREKAAEIDLSGMLEMIVSLYRDQDPPLPVRIVLTQGAVAASVKVHGREGALAQVFRNILDNAISFSPPDGRIDVDVYEAEHRVRVIIQDEGPGIPPESLVRVFERFYTHRPMTHGFGKNSGLGLSISKQIVESHGGTIVASNRRDRSGAIFTVELPAS